MRAMGFSHRWRPGSIEADERLLARFVEAFEWLDNLTEPQEHPPPDELCTGISHSSWGWLQWRPAKISTDRAELGRIYDRIPRPFPDLYERLVLSYRWLEVNLEAFVLHANPPGPTLAGLADEIFRDSVFVDVLIPNGYVPFARQSDACYDPLCFDLNSTKKGDCPIIRFEHEAILCHLRIGEREQVFPSFRELIWSTIARTDME
jgi:hypothetical protein